MKRLVVIVGAVVAFAGCNEEIPDPSANLRRPSGMAYVERGSTSPMTGVTVERDDLYIADAESEGVRVKQLRKTSTEVVTMTGTVTAQRTDIAFASDYLRSEAIYFPLVIAAAGFPEEISATREPDHAGLYVLAAAGAFKSSTKDGVGLLHLLDIRDPGFGASAVAEPLRNVPIGMVLLDQVVPGAIPVDVEVVDSSADGTRDLVLVVFDPIGGGPGQAALFSITRASADTEGLLAPSGPVLTATIAAAPRSILAGEDGLFLVSSAATSSITEIKIDVAGRQFIHTRSRFAGGPTAGLVSVPGYGALALRIDRASAVAFELESGAFVRSTSWFESPFTPAGERRFASVPSGEPGLGRIDFRGSPVGAGAGGQVATLVIGGVRVTRPSDHGPDGRGLATAVLVAHLDGRASFLVGSPPRLASVAESAVTDLLSMAGDDVRLVECSTMPGLAVPTDATFPTCDTIGIGENVEAARYRLSYQGTLANGYGSMAVTGAGEVVATFTDPAITDFTTRKIRIGDRIDVELFDRRRCTASATVAAVDIVDRGSVIEVSAGAISAKFTGPLVGYAPCASPSAVRYDVYPSGEEVVLAKILGETVSEVQARVQTADVVVDGAPFKSAVVAGGIQATLLGTALTCADLDRPRWCGADVECGPGRVCQAAAAGNVLPNTCAEDCQGADPGCVARPKARVCSGIELGIGAHQPLVIDLRNIAAGNAVSYATSPATAVFAPMIAAWYVSYPGFRTVARIQAGAEGLTQDYDR